MYISYGISGAVANSKTGAGTIVTRVLVDGKERKEFRGICGDTTYVHVSVFNRVSLPAGTHHITVQYRAATTITANSDGDWQIGYLKLIY